MDQEFIQSVVSVLAKDDPQKIYLFGSQARQEENEDSDFDFLVIKESNLPRHKRASQYRRQLFPYSYPVDIIVYTSEEFERRRTLWGPFPIRFSARGFACMVEESRKKIIYSWFIKADELLMIMP